MATSTDKLKAKVRSLSLSLDDLEEQINSLLSQSLPEHLAELDTIEQAKLQTLLPYLIYDLVFVYLKTEGIDPKTHSVIGELDRIRGYFDKISNAENTQTTRATVDKDAAGRFIKHAIAQTKVQTSTPSDEPNDATKNPSRVPVKVTSKMREREQYEAQLKKEDDESEPELAIIEDSNDMAVDGEPAPKESTKMKGKRKNQDKKESGSSTTKRRRSQIDPFTGEAKAEPTDSIVVDSSASSTEKAKKKKKKSSKSSSAS